MSREPWLPPNGGNLFQKIKAASIAAEKEGKKLYRLSIGQPSGAAFLSARQEASAIILSDEEKFHEYQDNGCVPNPDFARRFAQTQVSAELDKVGDKYAYLPIPGIKPMLGLCIKACRSWDRDLPLMVHTMTAPGYPVPETEAGYLGVHCRPLPIGPYNGFMPEIESIDTNDGFRHLVMVNFPHNPSGQIATKEYWRRVCFFCANHNVRLVNDGAYLALAYYDKNSAALADVAYKSPGLSFLEMYSASKAIGNGTGWRVGAALGSPDFIGDLATIKGNTDSGFCAPQALGALYALENDQAGVRFYRDLYQSRVDWLVKALYDCGLKPAVYPYAGFFTLWQAPKYAFGREMKSAEDFNFEMIRQTGIVGVHFHPYIRYAVCGMEDGWREAIKAGFEKAQVAY